MDFHHILLENGLDFVRSSLEHLTAASRVDAEIWHPFFRVGDAQGSSGNIFLEVPPHIRPPFR